MLPSHSCFFKNISNQPPAPFLRNQLHVFDQVRHLLSHHGEAHNQPFDDQDDRDVNDDQDDQDDGDQGDKDVNDDQNDQNDQDDDDDQKIKFPRLKRRLPSV